MGVVAQPYDLMDVYSSNNQYQPEAIILNTPPADKTDIYSVEPYKWDGRSRPDINNYTSPWIEKASETKYKYTGLQYKKDHNAAVTYAANQLQAALAQYDADLSFWNEQDERDYTDQSSQLERFEDAGFNMGYIYGQVDNGNSAVGYNQESAQFQPTENQGDELGGVKLMTEVVTGIISSVSGLAKAGVSLAKLPHEISLMAAQEGSASAAAKLAGSQTRANDLANDFTAFLRSHDSDGNEVSDIKDSISFMMQSLDATLKTNQANESFWNAEVQRKYANYCEKIWQQESKGTAYQEGLKFIESLNCGDNWKAFGTMMFTILDYASGMTSIRIGGKK